MRKFLEATAVLLIGGITYSFLEILWRGYTHWTMAVTGGVCFAVLYHLHVYCTRLVWFLRCLIGTAVITAVEFAVGCTVNLWLGWQVWNYSHLPLNLLGQICPFFSLLWFVLCAAAIPLCSRLRKVLHPSVENPSSTCNSNEFGI